MVGKIMRSQEGCSDRNRGIQTLTQDPFSSSNPLTRQGSLYALTFDEFQSQVGNLGKPLGSLNIDELLKAVLTVESGGTQGIGLGGIDNIPTTAHHLSRAVSVDLSKKTVDEVWQDIQQGHTRDFLDRKATLGNMTLEDFLAKAGVVTGQMELGPAQMPGLAQQQAQWINYHHVPPSIFVPGHRLVPMGGHDATMDNANYSENQMAIASSSPVMGNLSGTQATCRKRGASDDISDKSSERRQKRMIKNRESAARSRARNQAYTQELENKVSRLEKENERLKRQKEFEKMFQCVPPQLPKYQLRRTSSAPM